MESSAAESEGEELQVAESAAAESEREEVYIADSSASESEREEVQISASESDPDAFPVAESPASESDPDAFPVADSPASESDPDEFPVVESAASESDPDTAESVESAAESGSDVVRIAFAEESDRDEGVDEDDPTFESLARKWMICQIGNNCSNQVSDRFFKFALDHSHDFERLKREGKTPSLTHMRKKIVKKDIPGIKNDFRYQDLSLPEEEREDNEVYIQDVEAQPMKRFPPDQYELIGQVTRIEVIEFDIHFFSLHLQNCFLTLYIHLITAGRYHRHSPKSV